MILFVLKKMYKRSIKKEIKFQELVEEYEIYYKKSNLKQIKFENKYSAEEDTKQFNERNKKFIPDITELITVMATLDCQAIENNGD